MPSIKYKIDTPIELDLEEIIYNEQSNDDKIEISSTESETFKTNNKEKPKDKYFCECLKKNYCLVGLSVISFLAVILVALLLFSRSANDSVKINKIDCEVIKKFSEFKISFNKTLRLPNYSIHYLKHESNSCTQDYETDFELNSRIPESFKNTNFGYGHLVPVTDVKDGCSTFTMANIVPIYECFNRSIWAKLESFIRKTYKNYYILTVPEYNLENYVIDSNKEKLYVPVGFYKLIFDTYMKLEYNIYIAHNTLNCDQNFNVIGNYNKLPYFVY